MPDRHPVQESPRGLSVDRRVQMLEILLGQLWDQVWWMHLPFYRRWYYGLCGFRRPIRRFYEDEA